MTALDTDILSVQDRTSRRRVPLLSDGTIIGRGAACNVRLESRLVSRTHARLHKDPFGQWIIEDLQSHNGVILGGQRIKRAVIGPGQPFEIGPFRLELLTSPTEPAEPDRTLAGGNSELEDKAADRLISVATNTPQTLSGYWMEALNRLGECLSQVTAPSEVYAHACRRLCAESFLTAAVIRIPSGPALLAPEVLASASPSHAGRSEGPAGKVVLSRRVVERVRTTGEAVLGSEVGQSDALNLTVVESGAARSVACVPVRPANSGTEALYLETHGTRRAKAFLDFARAAARQMALAWRAAVGAQDLARRQQVERQLAMAREIQDNLIARSQTELPPVELALHYEPTLWVGGDYCDVWKLEEGKVAFAIGDVAGKGLPAALAMANLHAVLRASTAYCGDLLEIASYANRHVLRHMPEGRFITAIVGALDPCSGALLFVNAGHPIPFIVRAGEVAEAGTPLNPPLGVTTEFPATPVAMTLEQDEILVLFTDGVSEAVSPTGELFGTDRVLQALSGQEFPHCSDVVKAVVGAAADFRGQAPQKDDLTLLALRRSP